MSDNIEKDMADKYYLLLKLASGDTVTNGKHRVKKLCFLFRVVLQVVVKLVLALHSRGYR